MENSIPKLKIVLLGDSGVGKSSIINRFVFKKFKHKEIVDFPQVLSIQLEIDGKYVILQILDTNGQERQGGPGLDATFFNAAKGCMLVYDVNDSNSVDNLENWHNEFITRVISSQSDWRSFPFILLGNKDDKSGGKNKELSQRAGIWCQNKGIIYHLLASAKENKNLSEAFHYIAKLALRKEALNLQHEPQVDDSKVVEQQSTTASSANKDKNSSSKQDTPSHVPDDRKVKGLESDGITKVQYGHSQGPKIVESDNITKVQNGLSRNDIVVSQKRRSAQDSKSQECQCTAM